MVPINRPDPTIDQRLAAMGLSRRSFVARVGALGALTAFGPAIFAACGDDDSGSSNPGSNNSGDPGSLTSSDTVTVWDWEHGSDPAGRPLAVIDELFKAKYPDVELKPVAQPIENMQSLLTSAAQARKGPDVFQYYTTTALFAFRSSLVPVNDLVADLTPKLDAWQSFTDQDGQIWGIPYQKQGFVWYYNKALAAEAGITAAPTSYEEFVDALKACEAAGITGMAGGGKDGLNQAWIWYSFLAGTADTDAYDGLFRDGTLKMTDEGPRKAAEATVEVCKYTSDSWASQGYFDVGWDEFTSGKAAFFSGVTSVAINWYLALPTLGDDLGWFPTLGFGGNDPYYYHVGAGTGWAIPSYAENQQSGLDYATVAADPEVGKALIDAGIVPALKDFPTDDLPDIAKDILTRLAAFKNYNNGPTPDVETAIGQNLLNVITGATSLDDALEATQQVIDGVLAGQAG